MNAIPSFTEQIATLDKTAFPNRATEEKVRDEFDHLLGQALAHVEGVLVGQSDELRAQMVGMSDAAKALRDDLQNLRRALEADDPVDLDEWAKADSAVQRLLADGKVFGGRIDTLDANLADPLAMATRLQSKYPAMHRPDLLSEAIAKVTNR